MSAEVPLSPALLLAAAHACAGLVEGSGKRQGAPHGAEVERFLREACAPPCSDGSRRRVPWDVAFVHHVGYWSHYDQRALRSTWPLPATATVGELAQYAGTGGALRTAPHVGDLFLWWSAAKGEFIRTGIVAQREKYERAEGGGFGFWVCQTIEADANPDGSGTPVVSLQQARDFSPELGHQFIRWTWFDRREERPEVIDEELEAAAWSVAAKAPRAA